MSNIMFHTRSFETRDVARKGGGRGMDNRYKIIYIYIISITAECKDTLSFKRGPCTSNFITYAYTCVL